jgi:phosphate:Na+ symporter
MADIAVDGLKGGIRSLFDYSPELAKTVRECEDKGDYYEDILGTYLVKLSSRPLGDRESDAAAMFLRLIGDFERISDHGVGVLESAEELREKEISLTEPAEKELRILAAAVDEIMNLSLRAFKDNDMEAAAHVEPLEQVIDKLTAKIKSNHISRLQQGDCTIEMGFVLSDLITNCERISDHCSNIGIAVIEGQSDGFDPHQYLNNMKNENEEFKALYSEYKEKYAV